ncbi:Cas10/Cmr2 second palm domain-containing protein [Hydrogenimonas sp.]
MKTIAMTVGPIVDTLALGRKTSEIWAASYLFSKLMKEVIAKLRNIEGVRFLVPYADNDALFEPKDEGIGRFHDRFILQSETLTLQKVRQIVDELRDTLSDAIADAIKESPEKVRAQMADYIRCYILETEKSLDNPILDLGPKLDALELHTPPLPKGDEALRKFLRRNVVLKSKLAKDSFSHKPSFTSIPAIAAQEDDRDIETSEDFKNAYRYIAIVHADGDNLGKVLESYGQNPADFSEKLFDFGDKAAKTLEDFGAQTLFIGGDDLLFFAPVLHRDGRTIFDLIDTLSEDYASSIGDDRTTLSFGVSVTYYKYPLYEALERSREALFGKAKHYEGKNAVAVAIQKHSGQSFDFTIGKKETAYTLFKELLSDTLAQRSELPHSLHHKLAKLNTLFRSAPPESIANIFDNFFNEEIHTKKFAEGLEKSRKIVETVGDDKKAEERLFAMLSTIKLLRGDR